MSGDVETFLAALSESGMSILIKRLSANDTGATGGHQAGLYIPKAVAFALAPQLASGDRNPECFYPVDVVSHGVERHNRLVWYNEATRDECRITNWAHERKNSLVQPHLTGSMVILAFECHAVNGIAYGRVWFCESVQEEDAIESVFGPIDPGTFWFRHRGNVTMHKRQQATQDPCKLTAATLPAAWRETFPDTQQIISKTLEISVVNGKTADQRLLLRRDCEYKIFKSVEDQLVLPQISKGFGSVEQFVSLANSITNRRKSRSGRSLELHLRCIFDESSLTYSHGANTEGKKTPDFLFPSASRYHDASYPGNRLRMLGVKTTCKDRWRQVISEADRINIKHLATLQEGVSIPQFDEMKRAGIRLVVPKQLHRSYPKEIAGELMSLEDFIREIRDISSD